MKIERRCRYCSKPSTLIVDAKAYQAWQSGVKAQHAFPNLSAGEREMLISGYHESCFDTAFSRN